MSSGRALTDIETVTLARRKGMRGIVLKNHVVPTADRAALAMDQVPGIEVWGGIVLNNCRWAASIPTRSSGCTACPADAGRSCGCRPSIPTST
jgi:hypothetical protein